ncbi:MAG: hypothetical protein H3C34_12045 [Caldilineaceae bacterium]|nr:hypothetical protein [Caldilineaceae bacterium]
MSRVDTLYLIHHSHTDIGFTHDQPIVFDLHERFITQALELADHYAERDSDGAFRWTVENTYVLRRWLQHATPAQIERFQALERAGRIEVTAMFANITPLYDLDQLIESFQLLRMLRDDYGFTITSAMNCDVNGENWPLVDVLLDLGIEGFTMAINTHFGGAPLNRPDTFRWQGPSGRAIMAYNGWPYDQGWRFGIGRSIEEFEQVWWPRVTERLAAIDYPLPALMVQSYHPFGDNGSAFEGFVEWIDSWNAQGKRPRIVLSTPRQWWAAVKPHLEMLPVYRGDWTDYWNFGCGSSAREQATNRRSRGRLRVADAIAATLQGASRLAADPWLARSLQLHRQSAWDNLNMWDEHTWGADIAIRHVDSEDTASQWYAKASFAYNARSLSLLLQRDALAALARAVQAEAAEDLLLFNPLPWERTLIADVPEWLLSPRGTAEDSTAGRQYQDRQTGESAYPMPAGNGAPATGIRRNADAALTRTTVMPTRVPALGYVVVPRDDLVEYQPAAHVTEDAVVESERYRLLFDRERGGVRSWYDKELDHEWVDAASDYPMHGFVHEEVADHEHIWPRHRLFFMEWKSDLVERPRGWKPGWRARRRAPAKVLRHNVFHTPLGIEVVQILEAPGIAGPLVQSTFLPAFAGYVEFRARWCMGLDEHPEATYLLFPFNLSGATVHFDLGPQAVQPERDQLPGVCKDYFTVQNWVDFSAADKGVTVATPDNPMVQLGGFHYGANRDSFTLARPTLLGWVTNNYWETNFRAHQPGAVTARYRVQPHAGPFDESRAHRLGLEALYDMPLLQHMGERAEEAPWPSAGTLLRLPEPPVIVLHLKPSSDGNGVIVRLANATDSAQTATVGSGLLRITGAVACDLLEHPGDGLDVVNDVVQVELAPRQTRVIRLDTAAK